MRVENFLFAIFYQGFFVMSSSQHAPSKLDATPTPLPEKSPRPDPRRLAEAILANGSVKNCGETLVQATDGSYVRVVSVDPLLALHQTLRCEMHHGKLDLRLILLDEKVNEAITSGRILHRGKNRKKGSFLLSALEGAITGKTNFELLQKILEMAPHQIDAPLDFGNQSALAYVIIFAVNDEIKLQLIDLLFRYNPNPSKKR